MTVYFDQFSTDFGPFSVAVDDRGCIVAAAFGNFRLSVTEGWQAGSRATAAARQQLREYFSGQRRRFDLALSPRGTAFQQRVWHALTQIPYGTTLSYGELAGAVGNPKASRAVGSANGANPVCVIIPCHRVIAADGSLGGFGSGLPIKRRLLALEGSWPDGKG